MLGLYLGLEMAQRLGYRRSCSKWHLPKVMVCQL